MKRKTIHKRLGQLLTAAAVTANLCLSVPMCAFAENTLFISEVKLESGEVAYETLEAEGYHVMLVGLNADSETPVYLGYKVNTGAPITGLILSSDGGEGFDTEEGIHYSCVSHVDVDEGAGGGTGCLYATHDERAGRPLVGLDILRADGQNGEELLAIPNDGAEVVRRRDGVPADCEAHSDAYTIYLAQIRDGLVQPYISEIVPVTDTDRYHAVYTAAVWGYNYFIEGDIDSSDDTYTILACKRTADPAEAITNVTAVSAEMVCRMEEEQLVDVPEATEATEAEETAAETEPETDAAPENEPAAELALFAPLSAHAEDEEESAGDEVSEGESDAETAAPEEQSVSDEPETAAPEESEVTTEEMTEETEETTEAETEPQEALTGDAIGISGIEYARASRQEVPGTQPYYLYITRNPEAGNPVSMFYTTETPEEPDTLLCAWAAGFFGTKGASNAYTYAISDALYERITHDMTVYTQIPVVLLTEAESKAAAEEETTAPEEETASPETDAPQISQDASVPEEEPAPETESEPEDTPAAELAIFAPLTAHAEENPPADEQTVPEVQTLALSMLTAKEGLPQDRLSLGGLRTPQQETPVIEHTQRSDRSDNMEASVFHKNSYLALICGALAILGAAAAAVVIRRKHPEKRFGKKR